MNIYFLVEGKHTERIVYPKWLELLTPRLTQIKSVDDATENCYYLFSGEGYPSLLHNHLKNAIDELNEKKNFNYLVLCLDADESTVINRIQTVNDFLKDKKIVLNKGTKLCVIVQNRCFETWFLGNRKFFKRNPATEPLMSYVNFYNVQKNDPELMPRYENFETTSQFHHSYLKNIFLARNIRYAKTRPSEVYTSHYLNELIKRSTNQKDLKTFKTFLDFCDEVNAQVK